MKIVITFLIASILGFLLAVMLFFEGGGFGGNQEHLNWSSSLRSDGKECLTWVSPVDSNSALMVRVICIDENFKLPFLIKYN